MALDGDGPSSSSHILTLFSFSVLPPAVRPIDVTVDVHLHRAFTLFATFALDGIGPEHVAEADDSHTNRDGGQPKEDVEAINP